jgi:hypothetical protein
MHDVLQGAGSQNARPERLQALLLDQGHPGERD